MAMDGGRLTRVALVTGAAGGLGLEIAARLASDGFLTHVTSRSEARLASARRELVERGSDLTTHHAPTLEEEEIARIAEVVFRGAPQGSVLVNNAAQRFHAPLHDTPLDEWEAVIRASLTAAFLWTKHVVPHLRAAGAGRIINIAGRSGEMGERGRVAIVAAKSGLIGLTRATAREYAREDITCNAVSPAAVNSESVREASDSSDEQRRYFDDRRQEIPMGRFAEMAEVAGAVSWLVGQDAGFVTGQVIRVNGGVYA